MNYFNYALPGSKTANREGTNESIIHNQRANNANPPSGDGGGNSWCLDWNPNSGIISAFVRMEIHRDRFFVWLVQMEHCEMDIQSQRRRGRKYTGQTEAGAATASNRIV
jgi:hypothetical protein